jgi:hypothetical protein
LVTVAAAWDPAACRSAALLTPTIWPYWRTVRVQLDLELVDLPGQITSITPELRFLVYTKEKVGLKAQRLKSWANDEFMKLSPNTRKMIKGAVVVTKVAVKAATGV